MTENTEDTDYLKSIIKIEPEEFETIQEKAADDILEPNQSINNLFPGQLVLAEINNVELVAVDRVAQFACDRCDYKTAQKANLKRHILKHGEKSKCPVCKKEVASLKSHMEYHKPKKSCSICQRLILPICMKGHMKTHRTQKCGECEEDFESSEDLRRHKLRRHYNGTIHECHCGSVFRIKSILRDHQQIHNEEEEITCDVCQKHFSTTKTLKTHRKKQHGQSEEKVKVLLQSKNTSGLFICDKCGWKFPRRGSFLKHTVVHRNATMFCDLCPRSFKRKIGLVYHIMRRHMKLRQFQCDVCLHKAVFQRDLELHKLRHGSKTKCQICNKLVANMTNHLKSHVKEKCPICGKIYSNNYLPGHLKTHTKAL